MKISLLRKIRILYNAVKECTKVLGKILRCIFVLFSQFVNFIFIFMCIGILPEYVSVYYVGVVTMGDKEGVGCPRTGLRDGL